MANKAISELPQALNVNNQDLFVLEQSGIAKKLTAETFITEQGIIDALAEALDGHGGIQSVTLQSLSGRVRTYLITFTDQSATTFQVLDGTSISRIEKTSTAGLVDTYTVFMTDGTTSFFQVRNGQDGSATWDQINSKAPIITETVTGAIASFPDGADDIPVADLVVNIEPKQSGSGDPAPDNIRPISGWTGCNVTRAGKNLINIHGAVYNTQKNPSDPINLANYSVIDAWAYTGYVRPTKVTTTIGQNSITMTVTDGAYGVGLVAEVKAGQKYTFSATHNGYIVPAYYTANGTYISSESASTAQSYTVTIPANAKYIIVLIRGSGAGTVTASNIQLEVGSTASTYEPYQSTTLTVDWTTEAGTVYGGTLDVTTGVLTVDRKGVSLNGTEEWSATSAESLDIYILTVSDAVSVANDNTSIQIISDKYKSVSAYTATHAGRVANSIAIVTNTRIFVTVPSGTYADASAFKAALANSPLQVVYKLATPQTYQLTGQQLKTLYGTNNLFSNVGNVSVTYPADTKLFIEKLTMPTEDDMVANQAITSGKYFMIGNSLYLALANIASGAQITIGTNAQRVSLADALNAINT